MDSEIWKPVPGYESFYEASTFGNIRSLDRIKCNGARIKGRVLKGCINKSGYFLVTLKVNRRQVTPAVHRLIVETFLERPDLKCKRLEVNHKNGDKLDNRLENLEWCSPSDNRNHSYKILGTTAVRGSRHYEAKLTEDDVREIRRLHGDGVRQYMLAKRFGVTQGAIHEIIKRRNWAWLD